MIWLFLQTFVSRILRLINGIQCFTSELKKIKLEHKVSLTLHLFLDRHTSVDVNTSCLLVSWKLRWLLALMDLLLLK